jgi:hypothetical protein
MSVIKRLGKNLILIPFESWHAEIMDIRGEELNSEFNSRALMAVSTGPCVTLMENRIPIAAFGLMIVCRGTAEVWVLASKDISSKGKTLTKVSRWALAEGCKRYGIYRVQASIDINHVVRRRWAEFMGFHAESTMPRFGPDGETFIRYVKIIDEDTYKS